MHLPDIIRSLLLLFAFVFIGCVFFRKEQDEQLNWALFFSSLWVSCFLLLVNWISIDLELWQFNIEEDLTIFIPYDLYFVWVVFWGVLMPFLLKGRFILITAFCLFCLDVLVMPAMEEHGLIKLYDNWLWGEFLLIVFAYLPAHLWTYLFLEKKGLKWRSLLQAFCIALLYVFGLPFFVHLYFPNDIHFHTEGVLYYLQLAFITLLPGLVAVIDLAEQGRGTPFPYDPTEQLVESGVYAYIRNPIQWSMTLFFIPLALFYHSYFLLIGIIVSIAYTIGVSEPQEKHSMKKRFGDRWVNYKKRVPLWYFSWKPNQIPSATIYFQKNCVSCSEMKTWLEHKYPTNLEFEDAQNFKNKTLLQVTYRAPNGQLYTSVKAIAHALEHINLAWASLGWFMRLPGISHLLQLIINSMGLMNVSEECELND